MIGIILVILGIILLAIICGLIILGSRLNNLKTIIDNAASSNQNLANVLGEMRVGFEKVKSDIGYDLQRQTELKQDLEKTQQTLLRIESDYQARKTQEEAGWRRLENLEHIIAGTQAKGRAAESIVFEQLSKFPPQMMESRFSPYRGKEVEFALILPDQRRLPIDVKFPAEILKEVSNYGPDDVERARHEVEKEIRTRVKEASGYINPDVTTDIALCAIPDAAYSYCTTILSTAYQQNRVIILPYSIMVAFLLAFYRLYLIQFQTHSADIQKFITQVAGLEKRVDDMSVILKNNLDRAIVMLNNVSDEFRDNLATMKGTLSRIPGLEVTSQIPEK
jgi:DNA anti-recombination protein RmuC